jgi:cell division protein FtsB
MEAKRVIPRLLLIVFILAVIFLPGYSRLQVLREENEQYKKRIALLDEHNRKLEEELVRLEEDPAYLEKKAREKLGIVRKGEVIYQRNQSIRQ